MMFGAYRQSTLSKRQGFSSEVKVPLTEPGLGTAAPSEPENGGPSPFRLSSTSNGAVDDPYGFLSDNEDHMDDCMIRRGLAFSPGLGSSPKGLPATYDPYLDSLESPPCKVMSLSPLGDSGQSQKAGVKKRVVRQGLLKSSYCQIPRHGH